MPEVFISSVLGNSQKLDGGAMFGNAPRALWQKWILPDELGRIPLACRALLIEYDNKKILCEAGIGAFFEPKMAERFGVQTPQKHCLLENLKELNLAPEDIDYVVLSHLHFDHAGGLLFDYNSRQNGYTGLVFENAHYITSKEAYERASQPHSRDKASFIPELPQLLKDTNRLQLIEKDDEHKLFDGRMSFYFSDGHTPGQLLMRFQGNKESVFFCGDLVPGSHWVHVPITMGYDRFPEKIIDEKKDLYTTTDLDKTLFFFTHDSEVAMSSISANEKGRYTPSLKIPDFTRRPL